MTLLIDYATQHPNPAAIRAAGYTAVIRYLSTDPAKNLSKAEAASLHAVDLGIGLIWETTANRALGGEAAGAADGAAAVAEARGLGYPADAVLFANLGDFTGGDPAAIQAYYHAFRRVPGFTYQPGGYATSWKISELVKLGAQGVWWQNAMDDGGVAGSEVNPHASLYQRVKPTTNLAGSFDEDLLVGLGSPSPVFWTPAPPPPPPVPEVVGYVVYAGAAGGFTGRTVLSEDAGKTWS